MNGLAGLKRPIDFNQKIEIVDLTSDFEDAPRPAKRARSISRSDNSIGSTSLSFTANNSDNTGGRDSSLLSPKHRKDVASTNSISNSAKFARRLAEDTRESNSNKNFARKHKDLSDGVTRLSIGPSSRSREPVVIDLDTDGEDTRSIVAKANTVRRPSPLTRSPSYEGVIDLQDWILPEVKPITFDPQKATTLSSELPLFKPSLPIIKTANAAERHASGKSQTTQTPTNTVTKQTESTSELSNAALSTRETKPHTQSNLRKPIVNLPPTPRQQLEKEREVVKHMKQDADYVRSNPEVVKAAVDVEFDDNNQDANIYIQAAQKKFKKVERAKLLLDTEPILNSTRQKANSSSTRMMKPSDIARAILLERFNQLHPAPLTFATQQSNGDEKLLHGKFQFISDNIFPRSSRKKKALRRFELEVICQCIQTHCQQQCLCGTARELTDTKRDELKPQHRSQQKLRQLPDIPTYTRLPGGKVVLSEPFLQTASVERELIVFECGNKCSCSDSCINRVVQKGRKVALQIFDTRLCGFGVRAMENIVRGRFIDVYLGEVISTTELIKREMAASEHTPSYSFSLGTFVESVSDQLHLDGANFGSVTRFVNHSCDPNAKTFSVVLSEDTKSIYHIAFFAVKDIPAGTEITIDYVPEYWPDEDEIANIDSDVVKCLCGSANCKKQIWRPGKEKRGRRKILLNSDDD